MNETQTLEIAHSEPINIGDVSGSSSIQFSKISLKEDYCKKWNIHLNDFLVLTRNGELIRNVLYRIGGLNNPKLNKDRYFLLLKHVEAFYSAEVMKHSKSKDNRHLESKWCILDINGNEKVEFDSFKSPHLIKDSCIYSIDNKYYNIETGELYCTSYTSIESNDFLFLENKYDNDKSKRGVMQINKLNGSWVLFS